MDMLPSALSGDRREQLLYVLSLLALASGTLLCLVAWRVPALDVVAVAVASSGAAAWLLSNASLEGRTLVEVLPRNGFTVADAVVLPAALLVTALGGRRLRGG